MSKQATATLFYGVHIGDEGYCDLPWGNLIDEDKWLDDHPELELVRDGTEGCIGYYVAVRASITRCDVYSARRVEKPMKIGKNWCILLLDLTNQAGIDFDPTWWLAPYYG